MRYLDPLFPHKVDKLFSLGNPQRSSCGLILSLSGKQRVFYSTACVYAVITLHWTLGQGIKNLSGTSDFLMPFPFLSQDFRIKVGIREMKV